MPFSPFRAGGNSMENVPTRSCRVDVGTRGRRYECREDRNRGKTTLGNTKGIGLPIPFGFVPTSPRLPESRILGILAQLPPGYMPVPTALAMLRWCAVAMMAVMICDCGSMSESLTYAGRSKYWLGRKVFCSLIMGINHNKTCLTRLRRDGAGGTFWLRRMSNS